MNTIVTESMLKDFVLINGDGTNSHRIFEKEKELGICYSFKYKKIKSFVSSFSGFDGENLRYIVL